MIAIPDAILVLFLLLRLLSGLGEVAVNVRHPQAATSRVR